MNHDGSSFLCGFAAFRDFIFAAKEVDAFSEKGTENSNFFYMDGNEWFKFNNDYIAPWSAIAIASVKPEGQNRIVVAISSSGAFVEIDPSTGEEIHGQIKQFRFPLGAATALGDEIYACGMGRSVLNREAAGNWKEIGPGTRKSDGDKIVGFEGIGGFATNDIYAVGWNGEIWHKGEAWSQIDSPTSQHLNALCCADDKVYVVGDKGTMLAGRDDEWAPIELDRADNLQDVGFYDGTVYVVTDFEILKLVDNELVADELFADAEDVPETCLHLLGAKDGLLSMGPKDLFRLAGNGWERLV